MVQGVLLTGYYVFVMCEAHHNSCQLKAPACEAQRVHDLLILANAACRDYVALKIYWPRLLTIKLYDTKEQI